MEEGKTIPDSSRQDMHKQMTNLRLPILRKRLNALYAWIRIFTTLQIQYPADSL